MALFFFGPDVSSFSLAAVHPSACLINPTTCHHILSPVYCLSSPQGRQAKLTWWAVRLSYLMFPLGTRFLIKWKTSVKQCTPCSYCSHFISCIINLNEVVSPVFISILLLNQVSWTLIELDLHKRTGCWENKPICTVHTCPCVHCDWTSIALLST